MHAWRMFGGRVLTAIGIVGLLLVGGATFGAVEIVGANPPTTYYACLSAHGALSKVGTSAPTCTGGKQLISWNSQGPGGCPRSRGYRPGPGGHQWRHL